MKADFAGKSPSFRQRFEWQVMDEDSGEWPGGHQASQWWDWQSTMTLKIPLVRQ
jgi:hypothetical protein